MGVLPQAAGDQLVVGQRAEPAGASAVMPGGAAPVVIQAASASPSAGDEENPDPLQPLATHRPGTPGTGPGHEPAVGAHREQPAAVLRDRRAPATGTSAADLARQRPQHAEVQRHVIGAERGRLLRADPPATAPASNPPSISPPRAGRRYTAASTTLAIGSPGSTSGTGAVISSWWRTGATGTRAPASSATCRTQPPAASTTARAVIGRPAVSTPATRPSVTDMPTTGSFSSTAAPCSRQAVQVGPTRLAGSSM